AVMAVTASAVFAEADGPDFFKVVNVSSDDVLNIRVDATADSEKVGEIPAYGAGIQNLGCYGQLTYEQYEAATDAERAAGSHRRWCNIVYEGVEGWVSGHYLAEDSARDTSYETASLAGSSGVDEASAFWSVISIDGQATVGDTNVSFAPDGSIFGSDGCNRFNSAVRVSGDHLIVKQPYITTRMACAPGLLSTQETAFHQLLQSEPSFVYDPVYDQITLISGDGEIWAIMQRKF
ncbi:MAG: META domain-containing protein, partial [Alphaproteobacteria bacterium]